MRRSTCSNPRPHTSSPVSTWSFAPRTHKHWVTSLPSHFPPPGSPSLPLPKFCPIAHWNQGHVSPTESGGMYLWTSLFHEALFEVLPGDEGHELGEERHNTDPPPPTHTPRVQSSPLHLAPQQRGSLEWGRMCAHGSQGYIWNVVLDATFTFQQSQTTASRMFAELTSRAKLWFKDLV